MTVRKNKLIGEFDLPRLGALSDMEIRWPHIFDSDLIAKDLEDFFRSEKFTANCLANTIQYFKTQVPCGDATLAEIYSILVRRAFERSNRFSECSVAHVFSEDTVVLNLVCIRKHIE